MSSTKGNSGSMDAKREEFRKYLEKEGVLEYLTKQLVRLYEEADKPSNALDYLKNNFNAKENEVAQLKAENLEKENQQLKETVRILQSEKADLELQVQQLQKEAAASASNPSFEATNSPPKSLSSPAKIVEKIESDEDEPMETSKDKSNTKPTEEATSASPSKFDHARSPALLDNKEGTVEKSKTKDATSEKMESDDLKSKSDGEEDTSVGGDKSTEERSEGEKIPSE